MILGHGELDICRPWIGDVAQVLHRRNAEPSWVWGIAGSGRSVPISIPIPIPIPIPISISIAIWMKRA